MKTSQSENQLDKKKLYSLSQSKINYCPSNLQALFVCFNEKCMYNAFICGNQSCSCYQTHLTCPQILIKSIKRNIQAKIVPLKQTQQSILDKIQKTIDELSDFRQKLTTQIQNNLQLCGLNDNEQKFLNFFNKQIQEMLTGKNVFQMFNSMTKGQKLRSKNQLFESQFMRLWESVDVEIKGRTSRISQLLTGGMMGGLMNVTPQMGEQNPKTKLEFTIRDKEKFLKMQANTAKRIVLPSLKYAIEQAGIPQAKVGIISEKILKEELIYIFKCLESPTQILKRAAK